MEVFKKEWGLADRNYDYPVFLQLCVCVCLSETLTNYG